MYGMIGLQSLLISATPIWIYVSETSSINNDVKSIHLSNENYIIQI